MTASPEPRLPRGRHHLSRDHVVGTQRARILRALAETMTERGYVATPVAAVIERAGVSRETFYQQFSSKQDCFAAALEDTIAGLTDIVAAESAEPGTPIETFDRMLGAYLNALAEQPATARLFLIESYAGGPEIMARRLSLQTRFVDGIAATFGVTSEQDRFACEALVGAIISLVTARFVADSAGDLGAGLAGLQRPLVELAASLLSR